MDRRAPKSEVDIDIDLRGDITSLRNAYVDRLNRAYDERDLPRITQLTKVISSLDITMQAAAKVPSRLVDKGLSPDHRP